MSAAGAGGTGPLHGGRQAVSVTALLPFSPPLSPGTSATEVLVRFVAK